MSNTMVLLSVVSLLVGFAIGVVCMWVRMENKAPAHVHDWTRWEVVDATYTRYPVFGSRQPMVSDCSLQRRSCQACGYTQTKDVV